MVTRNNQVCTIYLLINKINGKIYVGQTWNTLSKRMGKEGCSYSNSPYIFNAIQKYGTDNFYYEILAECSSQYVADYLENSYINEYQSRDHIIGYNLKEGGSVGKHSEETKKKISETLKENTSRWTPEELAERSKPISEYWKGKKRGPQTKEHRAKVIQTLQPGGYAGHHHTEESKFAMSQKLTGTKRDPESIAKGAKKKQMPIERERVIIKAYRENMTFNEMVEKFEVGRGGIYRVLDRNNIPRRKEK